MVVLDPRTGRLVSISLTVPSETRSGLAAPRPVRPAGEQPPHRPEAQGAPPLRQRICREGS